MSTDLVAQFTEATPETVERVIRTDPDGFEATIAELVVEPAVGAPLPSEDVSLDGTLVNTEPSVAELESAETGVAQAGTAVAQYGTVSSESRPGGDELVSLYPPRHIVVVDDDDIVPDMVAAFDRFEEAVRDARENGGPGASRALATGPSSTGDIGAIVQGVHGPKEVFIVIVEDR